MRPSIPRNAVCGILTVVGMTIACSDNLVVEPVLRSSAAGGAPNSDTLAAEAISDSLAKGLASALQDVQTREKIRDVLRDSPFKLHGIHFASFLRGPAGNDLVVKAAASLGIGVKDFLRLAESTPNLELVMPRTLDRVSWDGGPDIDITATPLTLEARWKARRESEPGYDLAGRKVSVVTSRYSPRPFLIVRPASFSYPPDPERYRLEAVTHTRNTVTTASDERAAMRRHGRERAAKERSLFRTSSTPGMRVSYVLSGCDPEQDPTCCPEYADYCTPEPTSGFSGVGGGGTVLPEDMTQYYCFGVPTPLDATTDRDNDRIRDDCESELAASLAPLLNIGNEDSYPARQPYWSVSRHPDRPWNIQIIYALSYLYDGGCQFCGFVPDGGPHEGDSEFIILEITNAGGSRWGVLYATLSAHFGAEETWYGAPYTGADSYYWDDLDYPQGPFPRIWSSLDKHANYRNRAVCESGAYLQDSCHGDYVGTQIPAPPWRNLGNYYHVPAGSESPATQLVNCTSWEGPTWMYYSTRTGQECFWSDSRFSGWDPAKPDDVTPYRRIFQIFRF